MPAFSTRRIARPAIATLMLLAALTAWPAAADDRTINDGVYTSEQAGKGAEAHASYCAKCHHMSYYQGGFLEPWEGAPVSAIYDLIRMKMPEDRPGALRPREYAALLAYVLELNGYPPGTEPLGSTAETLDQIRLAPRAD
jgi:mono/diheme cytochrome c family protein